MINEKKKMNKKYEWKTNEKKWKKFFLNRLKIWMKKMNEKNETRNEKNEKKKMK